MLNISIRSVKKEELPLCLETIHQAFALNCARFGFTRENYPRCAAFMTLAELEELKASGAHVYGAWVDDTLAGCVLLKRAPENVYLFQKFAVLPDYQHLGLGRALVEHCKQRAIYHGGEKLQLLMVYENEALRHFYRSCGFRLLETRKDPDYPFLAGIYEMEL